MLTKSNMKKPTYSNINATLKEIIESYKEEYLTDVDSWIEYASNQKTLTDAIRVSVLCKDNQGKYHPHQYRIVKSQLGIYLAKCLNIISEFKRVKSFDELYKLVISINVDNIGKLTKYDIATRIGAYLKLEIKKVYLHAGTRKGAKKLLGKITKSFLLKSDLPEPFQTSKLSYGDIENILCIYKDAFSDNLDILTAEEVRKRCFIAIRNHC